MTLYGIATEPSERAPGDWLTVWSGAFMSEFEGQGNARPGSDRIVITLEWRGQVLVVLPDGVTFPRTDKNYTQIDDAINAAINYHLRVQSETPDLPPGDEHDTTPPRTLFGDEQSAPGADDI